MTKGIRVLGFLALVLVAVAVTMFASKDSRAAPPPFNPGGVVCFENLESAAQCDGNSDPGANPDIRSKFCVGWGADCAQSPLGNLSAIKESNFGAVVGFVPPEFVPTSNIPIGSIAGQLTSTAVLGLLNGNCSNNLDVSFTLMNASTNMADTIKPKKVGETNTMEPLALDANGNGIPDGADKYPTYLKGLFDPDFDNWGPDGDQETADDVNGPAGPLQPRARLFGIGYIQGGWVVLNFEFFDQGAHVVTPATDVTFNAALGFPGITVLQDATAQPAPGAISDFCAPLLSANVALGKTMNNPCTPTPQVGGNCPGEKKPNVGYPLLPCERGGTLDDDGDGKINDGCPQSGSIAESGAQCDNNTTDDNEDSDVNDGCPPVGEQSEGARIPGACSGTDEGGCVFRLNPAAGSYTITTFTASQRDADGDGIENGLDVCSTDSNPEWNPRGADPVNDPDSDGLPAPCDPSPNTPGSQSPNGCKAGIVGPDEDQDCFANRQDNCPTDNQLEDPSIPAHPDTNIPKIDDKDFDGIGDACDPNPDVANGEVGYRCVKFTLVVGQPATAVVGTVDPNQDITCAASNFVEQAVITSTPSTNNTTTNTNTNSNTGTNSQGGLGGPSDTGVGSLSPTANGIPLWAAVLAAIGGVGLLVGGGILRRSHARRRIE